MISELIAYAYKDSDPLTTIAASRSQLATYGVIAQETWQHVGTDVFSVHLAVFGTTLTANGKGSTKEMALASAYGELTERLSFLLPFRVSPFYNFVYRLIDEMTKQGKVRSGFARHVDFDSWLESDDSWTFFTLLRETSERHFGQRSSCKDLATRWRDRVSPCPSYSMATEFVSLIPFRAKEDVAYGGALTIPYAILDYYYGSNGMCAGNTEGEGLVQGICEIIERYVQRKLILGTQEEIYDLTESYLSCAANMDRTRRLLSEHGYEMRIYKPVVK